jgi:hypothetical protein
MEQKYTMHDKIFDVLIRTCNEIPVLKSLGAGSLTFNDKYNSSMLLLL